MNLDMLGISDIETGRSLELQLAAASRSRGARDATRTERCTTWRHSEWNSSRIWDQGPRRLGGDRNGDAMYVANWWGDNLAKINIRTHDVTYYQYPLPGFRQCV